MISKAWIEAMPKVEIHVHMEGSIRPETLLKLSKNNGISLPADTAEGLRQWYVFQNFDHFVSVYVASTKCIRTVDDVELIAYEFLQGQAEQNVLHSEVTYTAETIQRYCSIPWSEQFAAINRARARAKEEFGVTMEVILDIVREVPPEKGLQIADWAIAGAGQGVCALGLSGREKGFDPHIHEEAFRRAKAAGLKIATHAGETDGPQSIWSCLENLGADRIGHGVRCLDDDALVDELRDRQIPLEVCPTSNVKLCVASSIESHPIDAMINRGLNVSVNSDDPPIFNTTLTDEWKVCAKAFDWDEGQVEKLNRAAIEASFCSDERKAELLAAHESYFAAEAVG